MLMARNIGNMEVMAPIFTPPVSLYRVNCKFQSCVVLSVHISSTAELTRAENTNLWRGKIQDSQGLGLRGFRVRSLVLVEKHKLMCLEAKENIWMTLTTWNKELRLQVILYYGTDV